MKKKLKNTVKKRIPSPDMNEQEQLKLKGMLLNFLFSKFIKSPNKESYFEVRSALITSNFYNPYSDELSEIDELIKDDKLIKAYKTLKNIPNLLLSPNAHLTIAFIADKLNNKDESEMEIFIAKTCCDGILATGDGSMDNPYIVVRISDEYDILQYLNKHFASQQLLNLSENKHFDKITCEDNTEIWFDITDAVLSISKEIR
ncbi:MAG: hypothetical protein HQK76_19810 [Desulfobacterales bacterium]|nr:hypothetical protein [Desulfobacterales bacterium]